MIYRFRIILDNDTDEDIFRDLEIRETDTLEDLHNIITQSFGFDGTEMASFYLSNDTWDQGEEISLFDLSEDASARLMNETSLDSVVHEVQTKLIYVYDFMSMWTLCLFKVKFQIQHLKNYLKLIRMKIITNLKMVLM